jgi:acyl carrier protein
LPTKDLHRPVTAAPDRNRSAEPWIARCNPPPTAHARHLPRLQLTAPTTPPGSLCPACTELLRWLREYYADVPNVRIEPDTHLFRDLGVDSLDYIDWQLEAEDVFNIRIPDRDAERLHTVGQFITYLRRHGATWRPGQSIRIIRNGRWIPHKEFQVVENPPPDLPREE